MRPPSKDGSYVNLYDSCVDDTWNPKIFVVFDANQIYPEYLIDFHWSDLQISEVNEVYSFLQEDLLSCHLATNVNYLTLLKQIWKKKWTPYKKTYWL